MISLSVSDLPRPSVCFWSSSRSSKEKKERKEHEKHISSGERRWLFVQTQKSSYHENEACEGLKDDYNIKMFLQWYLSTQPAHEEVLKYHITRRKNLKTEVGVT